MGKDIKTVIKCKNLAPIIDLDKEITSSSLNFAIYANNGEGKTFISNMFRLTENRKEDILNEDKLLTDKFISLGKSNSEFSFKISNKQNVIEDFKIEINKGEIPNIPHTNYIYHVFNQTYIDENSKANYDKDGNITDYIMGKGNIDLSEEEKFLQEKTDEKSKLDIETKAEIKTTIEHKLGNIPNIKRLNEYKSYLNSSAIYNFDIEPFADVSKSFEDYILDFDKIKSVPENLPPLEEIPSIELDYEILNNLKSELSTQFELSKVADKFKEKILSKKTFIEQGLGLLTDVKKCPFCEQDLKNNASDLIDEYISFFNDEENKTIKSFEFRKKQIEELMNSFSKSINSTLKNWKLYTSYVDNYFSSIEEKTLSEFYVKELKDKLEVLVNKIDLKITNINNSIGLNEDFFQGIISSIASYNEVIDQNNKKILKVNSKLNDLASESKNIRRNLCKSFFNKLTTEYEPKIQLVNTLTTEIEKIKIEIKKKQEQNKINRKEKVAKTVSSILRFFFKDKYTLDQETFRLNFKTNKLVEGQATNILSEGEKSIIAFAYYIGDVHLKVSTIDDYDKIFFIIDDPISSMDFNHVYVLSSIVRELKEILSLEKNVRFILFTHNIEFMRIIVNNNIAKNSFLLSNSELKDFNNSLSIPYISHLDDLFKISVNKSKPNHTTPNSIRHILETITKFEFLELNKEAMKSYIDKYFKEDVKIYTMINDLSHGAWRNEQDTITESDYILLCNTVIDHIDGKYKNQIDYYRELYKN